MPAVLRSAHRVRFAFISGYLGPHVRFRGSAHVTDGFR